jgi:hypothetical protein
LHARNNYIGQACDSAKSGAAVHDLSLISYCKEAGFPSALRELNLFTEKKGVGKPDDFDHMADEELIQFIEAQGGEVVPELERQRLPTPAPKQRKSIPLPGWRGVRSSARRPYHRPTHHGPAARVPKTALHPLQNLVTETSRGGDLAIGLLVTRADAGVEDDFGCHEVPFALASGSGTR